MDSTTPQRLDSIEKLLKNGDQRAVVYVVLALVVAVMIVFCFHMLEDVKGKIATQSGSIRALESKVAGLSKLIAQNNNNAKASLETSVPSAKSKAPKSKEPKPRIVPDSSYEEKDD